MRRPAAACASEHRDLRASGVVVGAAVVVLTHEHAEVTGLRRPLAAIPLGATDVVLTVSTQTGGIQMTGAFMMLIAFLVAMAGCGAMNMH